jgi:hypothetical protein
MVTVGVAAAIISGAAINAAAIDAAAIKASAVAVPAEAAAIITAAVVRRAVIATGIERRDVAGVGVHSRLVAAGERDGEPRDDRTQKNPTAHHGFHSFAWSIRDLRFAAMEAIPFGASGRTFQPDRRTLLRPW